jgi:hypothetical protein
MYTPKHNTHTHTHTQAHTHTQTHTHLLAINVHRVRIDELGIAINHLNTGVLEHVLLGFGVHGQGLGSGFRGSR